MVKTSSGTDLKSKVWRYIKQKLSVPNNEMDGMAICPFIKQYLDRITVVETEEWERKISQVCDVFHAVGYEAIVICGPMEDYDELMSICDDYQSRYYRKDIEILMMHPDTDDFPLPLEYNFQESPLVIIQKASTLNDSRRLLQKSGKYYNYYK